jgi:uncharacterized protein YdeI (YjbR/CyaY-like superfamily)
MGNTNPKVDFFFEKDSQWSKEYDKLRKIVLACGLDEQLKWGQPCYMHGGSNIVLIHGFKEYCALLFFKGALMTDGDGLLIQQTANVQSARQMRFTDAKEITKLAATIKSYIYDAIAVEDAGLKVTLKKVAEYTVPEEFQQVLNKNKKLKTAFEALTPGRQRAYLLHFAAPKQTKTRTARVEKATPDILAGKGLNDL